MSTDEVNDTYVGGLESSSQVWCVFWGTVYFRPFSLFNRENKIDNIIFRKHLGRKL
jgi:hypothetical protein